MEIRVGPSQFRSAAGRVHPVPAKGVVGRLNSRNVYNKIKLIKLKKLSRITSILS